ncbi:MAG: ATP-binding protein [Calditrichia bacterium]|nr:ATP-binding protein [Calditrichia bacterium]
MKNLVIIFCILILTGLLTAQKNTPQLIEKWATKAEFKIPESVCYNSSQNILYVANINGSPTEKNGKGFISKLSVEGKIEKLEWITGLNAPKGMGVFKNKLYVTDIDRIVEIDIKKGKVLKDYPVKGAVFLNDIAIDENGIVYFSEMDGEKSCIYRLKDNIVETWLKNAEVSRPNGLYAEKHKLVFGNSGDGKLKAVSYIDQKISLKGISGKGIDGVEADGKGNYIISDWSGQTDFVTAKGEVHMLLNTTSKKINAADIEYIKEKQLLLIPTFFDNRVVAYELKY